VRDRTRYSAQAAENKVDIVSFAGYDSVPLDVSVRAGLDCIGGYFHGCPTAGTHHNLALVPVVLVHVSTSCSCFALSQVQ
jgi:hypothetical protein